jgi:hypothetical protein
MSMNLRRAIVWLVAILFGVVVTGVIIYAKIPLGPVTIGFGTNVTNFAYSNVGLLFIAAAGIAWIWLDYFLDTKYLKS